MKVTVLLGVVLLFRTGLAAEESCVDRCGSFDSQNKCQCDSMCLYYGSCCADYDTACPKKIARGDTFAETEDVTDMTTTVGEAAPSLTPPPSPISTIAFDPVLILTPVSTIASDPVLVPTPPSENTDPNAASCSGQPFDAFLQLKNSSIYAFRGEYFFELDDKSVLPGYPKLIEDVWGIPGPIDAAFTRINCQGKTYIFKGSRYWRFDGDVLDKDFPRDISVGFDRIPSDVNAAFAVPAASHLGKEKAYFFKDDKYYQYEFKHQPSHEECVEMTRSSPSVLFTRYTDLFCDQTFEDLFRELFGPAPSSSSPSGPRLIRQDWSGLSYPVDAALVGRVQFSPKPTPTPPITFAKRHSSKRKSLSKRRGSRRSRYVSFEDIFDDLFDYTDYTDYTDTSSNMRHYHHYHRQPEQIRATPVQSVYFFKKDKYYRVDLQRKRVDTVRPPYPRSIAKYWLGCESEQTPDTSKAEK